VQHREEVSWHNTIVSNNIIRAMFDCEHKKLILCANIFSATTCNCCIRAAVHAFRPGATSCAVSMYASMKLESASLFMESKAYVNSGMVSRRPTSFAHVLQNSVVISALMQHWACM